MIKYKATVVHLFLLLMLIFPIGLNSFLFADAQSVEIVKNKYGSRNSEINYKEFDLNYELTHSLSEHFTADFSMKALYSAVDLEMGNTNVNKKKVAVKDEFKLNYHILNKGNKYDGSAYLGVYFSKDQVLDKNDVNVDYVKVNINNKNISGNIYLTVPNLEEGDYYLLTKIDDQWGSSAINEIDESNNEASLEKPMQINVQPTDIKATVTNVSVDYNYIVVNYTLSNLSDFGVGEWDAKVYLSSDQVIDADDRIITSIFENTEDVYLNPNSSLGLDISDVYLFPSEYLPAGDFYILFDFNASRSLPETDYDNNIGISKKFTIDPYAHSLNIDEVSSGDKIYSSDETIPFTLDWTNDGETDIDGLYLELTIKLQQTGNSKDFYNEQWVWLASGNSESIDLEIDMPEWMNGGEATLVISSDYSNTFEKKIDITPDFKDAKVTVEDLKQTYSGLEKEVKIKTEPENLTVEVTYNGSKKLPVDAGKYEVLAQVVDNLYKGKAEANLIIEPASAKIQIENTSVIYDGKPQEVKVTTEPENLPFDISYDGKNSPPANAGTYKVEVDITDPNYVGSTTAELNILAKEVSVSFSDLEHVYDGELKSAVVKTTPEDLDFSLYYYDLDTIEQEPVNAGSYLVKVEGNENNYKVTAWATLKIAKAESHYQLTSDPAVYDGNVKTIEVIAMPSDVKYEVKFYDKDTVEVEPVNAGEYLVLISSIDQNYEGEEWGMFNINPAISKVVATTQDFTYDGNRPKINYSSDPAALKLSYNFYDLDTIAAEPVDVGDYLVKAVVEDKNYTGEAWGKISIKPAGIDFSFAKSTVTYNGSEQSITVIPSLDQTEYSVSYWQNDVKVDPVQVGEYEVKVEAIGQNYKGSAETTFKITPATVEFNFDQTVQEYTGGILEAEVTTNPANVAFEVSYFNLDSNAVQPLEAGKYLVKVSSAAKNYTGTAWTQFEITPTIADIVFEQLQHEYDGNAKKAMVYTNPAGLQVKVKYEGKEEFPVEAGIYEISASVDDISFTGDEKAYLEIEKAEAEIIIGDLVFANDEPQITITTMPSGLHYEILYVHEGDTTAAVPSEPGEYQVVVEIDDSNFQGRLVKKMVITGTALSDANDIFSVYPNPVANVVSFNTQESQLKVQLIDTNGKLVKDWNLHGKKSVDLSFVPSGNYIINIQTKQKQYTRRILKL